MAIKFDINYICSPLAVLGELYYRHVLPDGTYSPWVFNTTVGTFSINTAGGTVTNQLINDVYGNPPEFFPATTYQFFIRQTCSDEVTVDSPISGDIWVEQCPYYTVSVQWNPDTSSYDFIVSLYDFSGTSFLDPDEYSIINYSFAVYQITGGPTYLGTYVVPYTDIQAALPLTNYTFPITSADLVDYQNPGQVPVEYQIVMSLEIATSTGTETFSCPPVSDIIVGECDTYAIYTGENWALEWEDCNGFVHKIGNKTPAGRVFYICARQVPKGYACVPTGIAGVTQAEPPKYINGTVIHPIGGYVSSGWTPVTTIKQGAVVEFPPGPGCDGVQYSYANLSVPTSQGGQGISFTSVQC